MTAEYATFPTPSQLTVAVEDETEMQYTQKIAANGATSTSVNINNHDELQRRPPHHLSTNTAYRSYSNHAHSKKPATQHSQHNPDSNTKQKSITSMMATPPSKQSQSSAQTDNDNHSNTPLLYQTCAPTTPRQNQQSVTVSNAKLKLAVNASQINVECNTKQHVPHNDGNTMKVSLMSLNGDDDDDDDDDEQKDAGQHANEKQTEVGREAPSQCTNDPGAPIVSLEKARREFKTVSQAAYRFQFVCDAYRRCKLGSVKEKDFLKLEDVLNYVYEQLLKRKLRNSKNSHNSNSNDDDPSKSPLPALDACSTEYNNQQQISFPSTTKNVSPPASDADFRRPKLTKLASPICAMCNKSFPSKHCFTTCHHPLCIKCLVNVFTNQPRNSRWYLCAVNECNAMLPPQSHFLVLSYKPAAPPNFDKNTSSEQDKAMYKRMMSEYARVRNLSYKNMLKIVGEYFGCKLKYYERWRKCENCDFGFLADPDVHWHQIFELKCVVCSVIQRVQLLGPPPCSQLVLKPTYYPNDALFKTLVFVRHGEAENNVRPSQPNLIDPNLTARGRQQCKHLHQYFGSILNVDCILTSSMNRCIQTAIVGVYGATKTKADYNKDKCSSLSALETMNSTKKKIPFVALECLRERLSPGFNRREVISVKKEKYKQFDIDFSECKCEQDLYFEVEHKNEKYEEMNKRAWQFWSYLMQRKEQTIAIVSHEGMLQCLLNIVECSDKILTRNSFKNAEARICFLNHRK